MDTCMWQEIRDYWLPFMLFAACLLVAAGLVLLVVLMPFLIDYLPVAPLVLFAEDTTIRRTAIVGAVGLTVTAFVFLRPNSAALARKAPAKKPTTDSMAGA
jgi:hypothetical protein